MAVLSSLSKKLQSLPSSSLCPHISSCLLLPATVLPLSKDYKALMVVLCHKELLSDPCLLLSLFFHYTSICTRVSRKTLLFAVLQGIILYLAICLCRCSKPVLLFLGLVRNSFFCVGILTIMLYILYCEFLDAGTESCLICITNSFHGNLYILALQKFHLIWKT